jgi:hypothetical protein
VNAAANAVPHSPVRDGAQQRMGEGEFPRVPGGNQDALVDGDGHIDVERTDLRDLCHLGAVTAIALRRLHSNSSIGWTAVAAPI